MRNASTYRSHPGRAAEAAAARGRLAGMLTGPARFWSRAGERVFHYQLLRAQMIERAFRPDQDDGPCPETIDGSHDE